MVGIRAALGDDSPLTFTLSQTHSGLEWRTENKRSSVRYADVVVC